MTESGNTERPARRRIIGFRFWKIFIAAGAWLLATVALLNLIVDPFGMYGTGLFPSMVSNRYLAKLTLFRADDPPPSALILGSSRVGMIDPDLVTEITGEKCFSWGVPIARAETFLAIIKIAIDEVGDPIDLVIVGAEPEVFHPTSEVHPMAKFVPEFSGYGDPLPWWSITVEKVSRLFTMEQTEASIGVISAVLHGERVGDWIEWGPDGFPVGMDPETTPRVIEEDFETRLKKGLATYPDERFEISSFTHLSPERMRYWEEFLQICEDNDIRIYVFMPPPHPKLLDRLYDLGAERIFDETSEYLERTVTEAGGTFRDFTRLESFGGDPNLFSDEVHLRKPNAELMLRNLLSDFPDRDQITE
jgi:hypothetical protein